MFKIPVNSEIFFVTQSLAYYHSLRSWLYRSEVSELGNVDGFRTHRRFAKPLRGLSGHFAQLVVSKKEPAPNGGFFVFFFQSTTDF